MKLVLQYMYVLLGNFQWCLNIGTVPQFQGNLVFLLSLQMGDDQVVPHFSRFLHDDPYVKPYQTEIERR